MSTLHVIYGNQHHTVPFGTTSEAWADHQTVAVLVNGRLASLKQPLVGDAVITPVTLSDRLGHRVYRRTLSFLLEITRRRVALPALVLGPSWGGGHAYDTSDGNPLTKGDLKALGEALAELITSDLDLKPVRVPFTAALAALDHPDDADARLFLSQKNPAEVTLTRCGEVLGWEPEPLLASTGKAHLWAIEPSPTGLVLRMPAKAWPLVLAPWKPSKALAKAHTEDRSWSRVQEVATVAQLNALAGQPARVETFVQGAEAVHERRIATLADAIVARGARVVLIAGPSSSGKTTTAKRLAVQLQACGRKPLVVSLDDYFVNREDTPKDSEGHYDFEALEAMDKTRLASDLETLLTDGTAQLPVFDFKSGHRKSEGRPYRLGSDGVLILEGIHGLNRDLWPQRPEGECFTLFVSALTSLTREGRSRISTSDHRLLRRLVRDRQFRGYSALQTLRQWASVRRGEDAHLFPYQDSADGVFNSALPYEFAVLREAALPLLETVPPGEPEYVQARFLHSFLEGFTPVPVRYVPPFSLLREFLGQSGFHY